VSLILTKTLEKAFEQKLKPFVTSQMLTEKLKQLKANAVSIESKPPDKDVGKKQPHSPSSIAEAIIAEPRLLQQLKGKLQVAAPPSEKLERQQILIEELFESVKNLQRHNEELITRVSALERIKPPEVQSFASGGFERQNSNVFDLRAKAAILSAQMQQSVHAEQRLMAAFGF
jgi:hypothetical protein